MAGIVNQTADEYLTALIRRGRAAGTVPELDSAEWRALPDTDVRRVAAVAVAALSWLDYWSPASIRARTEDELAAAAQLDAVVWDRTTAKIRKITSAPSFAKLERQWRGGEAS